MPTTAPASALTGRRIADIPAGSSSFMCLALVKRNTSTDREWKLAKPGYCIYEYTSWAVDKHEIRWGDGSGQTLGPEDLDDVVLLREFGEADIDLIISY